MTKIAYISAVILLASAAVAHAQTTPAAPITQGAASVNKNLAKDPDNKGLQNAAEQLKENQAMQAEKKAEQEKKKETHTERKEERHDKMERHEKIERHDKVERPAKIERPGK